MEKINLENVIKSFFLGLFLGVLLQFYSRANVLFEYKVLAVLASGSIGFIIGLITEWLTSLLPIRMANSRMYFFINNLIALLVATILMVSLILITGSKAEHKAEFVPLLSIVLGVICIANLTDYMMYRRAQNKLQSFKALIKEK